MRGILFKEELFLQISIGRKTETRRTGGLDEVNKDPDSWLYFHKCTVGKKAAFNFVGKDESNQLLVWPRYQSGETVYLKEPTGRINGLLFYAFDYIPGTSMRTDFKGWSNKLFHKADDARHFIKITGVSVERAWDITEEGAIREGVKNRAAFESIWQKINGISSWKANPWVFKYEFIYAAKP